MDLYRVRDRVLGGIDGPDAAGKTTLAHPLALACCTTAPTTAPTVTTLRASCDAFHQPRSQRYARLWESHRLHLTDFATGRPD
jgi:uridine kinase